MGDNLEKCIWKLMEENYLSTTFESVKELPLQQQKQHPLYNCIVCDGFDKNCIGYCYKKRCNNEHERRYNRNEKRH